MILMGADLASYKTGLFFLDTDKIVFKSSTLHVKNPDTFQRIRDFREKTEKVLELYKPDLIIVESTYLDKANKKGKKRGSVQTLKTLEKFHGAFLAQTKPFSDIHYMAPSEHKETLTGMGNAIKQSTIWEVQRRLGITNMTDDEADAAALVLTYLVKMKQWDILDKIKEKFQ